MTTALWLTVAAGACFSVLVCASVAKASHYRSAHGTTIVELQRDNDAVALLQAWRAVSPSMLSDLTEKLDEGDTFGLYQVQIRTISLLEWAALQGDAQILREVGEVYSAALPYAVERTQLKYFYVPNVHGHVDERLAKFHEPGRPRAWLNGAAHGNSNVENILNSSQFLYGVARLLRASVETDVVPARFEREMWSVLIDHVFRWTFERPSAPGSFQRTGWGCGTGTYSHLEHLRRLVERAYGESRTKRFGQRLKKSYCNAVTDTDLYIIAIVGEMLVANGIAPSRFKLSGARLGSLEKYFDHATSLVRSRITPVLTTATGKGIEQSLVFDRGAWDDYPDMRYSGDEESTFPGWAHYGQPVERAPNPAEGVGWDLSHARRLIQLIDTFDAINRYWFAGPNRIWPNELRGLANQLVLGTWNGDVELPLFSNYADGTNGWYRVNYDDRPNYGIPPFGFSVRLLDAGYGSLGCRYPELRRVLFRRALVDLDLDHEIPIDAYRKLQWIASVRLIECE